jgi:hypothetical protein
MKNRPQRLNCFLVVWLTMFSLTSGWGQNTRATDVRMGFFEGTLSFPGSPPSLLPEGFLVPCPLFPSGSGYLNTNGETKRLFTVSKEMTRPPGSGWSVSEGKLSGTGLSGPIFSEADLSRQPADYIYLHSGFFCRREWEIEKATHVPIRFRIGSLADCDAMEGKH